MHLLDSVNSPADLRALSPDELPVLAAQIREFLIPAVARTGGHLGPNLGVVELTIALHRVFDSPRDALLWDTGHQTYVHKILTGRRDAFATLRQPGGLSGYPSRAESPHDWIENSHASTALSYADGLAKAWDLTGELGRRRVVAIVGDGSLTGGMAWEALNTIAAHDRQVIVVVNDNARSYAPTIGGLAQHLATLRTTRGYERLLHWGRDTLTRTPVVGAPVYGTLHGLKKGMKDMFAPQGLFEDLGLKYIGPIDGHDIDLLERTLTRAAGYPGPVIVHCLTEKGRGYRPAEEDEADRFHGIGVIDPVTGQPTTAAVPTWTGAFSAALLDQAAQRPEVVAITAAMPGPTGLATFAERYPRRYYDVGIAEQHAVTSAAGLALGGRHPVVALYATFLNRAYDQVLLDVAMHKLPVTFVLDRAGITGDDGPSHNGMWDLSMLAGVPGLRVAAPRDGDTLRDELADALGEATGPTALRFPKGPLPAPLPALRRRGDVDVLAHWGDRVLIVAVGALAHEAVAAAELLHHDGIDATVVDPRWVLPVGESVLDLARAAELVVVAEDNSRHGGVAAAVARLLPGRTVLGLGIEPRFQPQGRRAELLAAAGLTAAGIAEAVAKATLALPDVGD